MNGTAPNGTNAQRRDATPTEVGTEPRGARGPRARPGGGRNPRGRSTWNNYADRARASAIDEMRAKVRCVTEHGVRGPPPGVYRREVQFLRLRCARCACGLYVLRTPLGPPEPRVACIACPTSNMMRTCDAGRRIRGVVCVRVCPSVLGRGVDKSQDCGPPWSSEEAEEFGEWWGGRRGRWSKEHDEALVVVVAHTCGDEDGDADEQ